MPRALIAGCGFVGEIAARLLQQGGWDVTGVTRSDESAARLTAAGLSAIACDVFNADSVREKLAQFEVADAIVNCASAGHGGEEAYRAIYFDATRNLLDILRPKKILFTGSTSVYAQNDGSWVTEESPAEPVANTAKILREAEELVLEHHGIVARLTGIYGPGRSMLLQKFLNGTAVIEEQERFINQIHRNDAAGAICFLLNPNAASGIYNVTDDTPVTQRECYGWLAAHFQKPLPPTGPADTNRKRGVTNKRVSNAKLRALGWRPQFPSMREALTATIPAV
jgi:nucleoside-diphosphate-sugar epimerase